MVIIETDSGQQDPEQRHYYILNYEAGGKLTEDRRVPRINLKGKDTELVPDKDGPHLKVFYELNNNTQKQ